MVIRRVMPGVVIGVLALQGCTTSTNESSQLRRADSPAQAFELWFCVLKPVSLVDNTNDGVIGLGDAEAGTLQLRGLQSFVLSATQAAQADSQKDGQASLPLQSVLPDSATFTVVGGGDKFAGLVGTAS